MAEITNKTGIARIGMPTEADANEMFKAPPLRPAGALPTKPVSVAPAPVKQPTARSYAGLAKSVGDDVSKFNNWYAGTQTPIGNIETERNITTPEPWIKEQGRQRESNVFGALKSRIGNFFQPGDPAYNYDTAAPQDMVTATPKPIAATTKSTVLPTAAPAATIQNTAAGKTARKAVASTKPAAPKGKPALPTKATEAPVDAVRPPMQSAGERIYEYKREVPSDMSHATLEAGLNMDDKALAASQVGAPRTQMESVGLRPGELENYDVGANGGIASMGGKTFILPSRGQDEEAAYRKQLDTQGAMPTQPSYDFRSDSQKAFDEFANGQVAKQGYVGSPSSNQNKTGYAIRQQELHDSNLAKTRADIQHNKDTNSYQFGMLGETVRHNKGTEERQAAQSIQDSRKNDIADKKADQQFEIQMRQNAVALQNAATGEQRAAIQAEQVRLMNEHNMRKDSETVRNDRERNALSNRSNMQTLISKVADVEAKHKKGEASTEELRAAQQERDAAILDHETRFGSTQSYTQKQKEIDSRNTGNWKSHITKQATDWIADYKKRLPAWRGSMTPEDFVMELAQKGYPKDVAIEAVKLSFRK